VTVDELVGAVSALLNGCPFTGAYAAHVDVGDGQTAVLHVQVAPDGSASGTLSLGAPTRLDRAGLHIEFPLLTLTGSVDLDSGAYHLTGTAQSEDGDVPVDVSGQLPASLGSTGSVELAIGAESFAGSIAAGNDIAPTATRLAVTPTPTATSLPASYPTPGASCVDGSISLAFSAVTGANSYLDLSAAAGLGKAVFRANAAVFGGEAVPCSVQAGDVVRRVQFIYFGTAVSGAVIPLGRERGQATFDYIEMPSSNPLGARGWRSSGGTLVIDALSATQVRFHVVDALMTPEPSFSFQTPASGSFLINAGAAGALAQ
jgi:hypothetical protein